MLQYKSEEYGPYNNKLIDAERIILNELGFEIFRVNHDGHPYKLLHHYLILLNFNKG